jgi:hypothetical protein
MRQSSFLGITAVTISATRQPPCEEHRQQFGICIELLIVGPMFAHAAARKET